MSLIDLLGLSDWINLLPGNWRDYGAKSEVIQYEGATALRVARDKKSGTSGATIYEGNGPPPNPRPANCPASEIEFQYKFIEGANSGFYFSIPSDANDYNSINSMGLELQLVSPGVDIGKHRTVDQRRNAVSANKNTWDRDRINNQNAIIDNTLLHEVSGSIYGKAPLQKPLEENQWNADWNSVRVLLENTYDDVGLNITIFINGAQVNRYTTDDGYRGHGRIGFQAHETTDEVLFKNIRWRALTDTN